MGPAASALLNRLFARPVRAGRLTLPPPGLVALAAIGAGLLLVVASLRWAGFQDEHAYWLAAQRLVAGQPLYNPTAQPGTPYAYWYPPVLAQVLAPFTLVLSDLTFSLVWTALLLGCLVYLADRRLLVALAMVAFLPVAVELWYRNVHLVLAALVVLALRRWPYAWIPATAIKMTPVIGLVYMVAGGRLRDAFKVGIAGLAVLAFSAAVSPQAWQQFVDVVVAMGGTTGASLVPVPFLLRLVVAILLAVLGGRVHGRFGESLLVIALVVGNPTLWATSLSLLVMLVPVWLPVVRESGPGGETLVAPQARATA